MCLRVLPVCTPYECSARRSQKRVSSTLDLELEMLLAATWVLGIELRASGRATTAEPSLQPGQLLF